MKRKFLKLITKLLNAVPGSTRGSRVRNLVSYYFVTIALLLIGTIFVTSDKNAGIWAGTTFAALSFVYFFLSIVWVIFLVSEKFEIDPIRLVRDIVVSAFYTIVSFAFLFKQSGIVDNASEPINGISYLYFSAVTFSTLGYGDISPTVMSRPFAALEALFGNLHLGLIAGAAFLIINALSKRNDKIN